MLDSAENPNGDAFSKGLHLVSAEMDEDEKKFLRSFETVMEEFTRRRPNMPVFHIIMMLHVAMDEGKSQIHYSKRWELPPATVSRILLDFSTKMRHGKPGLGLLELRTSAHSLREQEVYLSEAGRTLWRKTMKRLCK